MRTALLLHRWWKAAGEPYVSTLTGGSARLVRVRVRARARGKARARARARARADLVALDGLWLLAELLVAPRHRAPHAGVVRSERGGLAVVEERVVRLGLG